jgi:hypothetical protein
MLALLLPTAVQVAGVQYILDTVMQALQANPHRKFIYSEMVGPLPACLPGCVGGWAGRHWVAEQRGENSAHGARQRALQAGSHLASP